jgi:hypothetical protein
MASEEGSQFNRDRAGGHLEAKLNPIGKDYGSVGDERKPSQLHIKSHICRILSGSPRPIPADKRLWLRILLACRIFAQADSARLTR